MVILIICSIYNPFIDMIFQFQSHMSPSQVSYYDQMTACENKQEKLEQIACEVHERLEIGCARGLELSSHESSGCEIPLLVDDFRG